MHSYFGALIFLGMVSLITHPLFALAQDNGSVSNQAEACSTIKNDKKRLACYDALFKASKSKAVPVVTAPQKETKPAKALPQTETKSPTSAQQDFGLPERQKKQQIDTIETSLVSFKYGRRSSRVRLTLANGQVWDTTEKIPARLLKKETSVIIKKGRFGGFKVIFGGSKKAYGARRYAPTNK